MQKGVLCQRARIAFSLHGQDCNDGDRIGRSAGLQIRSELPNIRIFVFPEAEVIAAKSQLVQLAGIELFRLSESTKITGVLKRLHVKHYTRHIYFLESMSSSETLRSRRIGKCTTTS